MPSGRLWKQERYDQIIEEQVSISYAASGISMEYTDDISPYERKMIFDTIMKIQEAKKRAMEEARENRNSTNRRPTSRFSR